MCRIVQFIQKALYLVLTAPVSPDTRHSQYALLNTTGGLGGGGGAPGRGGGGGGTGRYKSLGVLGKYTCCCPYAYGES